MLVRLVSNREGNMASRTSPALWSVRRSRSYSTPVARRSGSIVNVASVAARLGAVGTIGYSVSKAGVVQLTNVAAIELAPHNVRVNAVGPGTFATEMSVGAYADPALHSKILPRIPMGRM